VTRRVRLDQLNLIVNDVPASRAFYARLGVGPGDDSDERWARHHVGAEHTEDIPLDIDLDSTTFAPKWNQGWPGGSGVVLGFKVESRDEVDELVAELVGVGATVQQPPFDAFWGARYAVISDPEGLAVGIMSPVDPAQRYEGPDPE
jgi:catechol 2,3-dioxygenase-like lactoylglutathione lyase family enzyme